jgi:hypothetical protein
LPLQQRIEASGLAKFADGCLRRFGHGSVPAGVKRDDLLNRQLLAGDDVDRKLVGHRVRPMNDAPLGLASRVSAHDAVARGHRDADVRLARLGDQQQEVLIARFCRKGGEMAAGQIPIPLHASVLHAAVYA